MSPTITKIGAALRTMPMALDIISYCLGWAPGILAGAALVVGKRWGLSLRRQLLLVVAFALIGVVAKELGQRIFGHPPPDEHLGPDWAVLAFAAGCGAITTAIGWAFLVHPQLLAAALARQFRTNLPTSVVRQIAIFAVVMGVADVALVLPLLLLTAR